MLKTAENSPEAPLAEACRVAVSIMAQEGAAYYQGMTDAYNECSGRLNKLLNRSGKLAAGKPS